MEIAYSGAETSVVASLRYGLGHGSANFSSLICISPDSLATVCFAAYFRRHGDDAYSRGGGRGLGVRVRVVC